MSAAAPPKRTSGFSIDAIIGNSSNARHSAISSGHLNVPRYSKDRPRDPRTDSELCAQVTSASPSPRTSGVPHSGKHDDEDEDQAEERRAAVGTIESRVPVPHPHLPSPAQLKSPLTVLTPRTQDRGRGDVSRDAGLSLSAGLAAGHCPELLAVRSLWGLTARAATAPHLSGLLGPTMGAGGLPPSHSFGSPFPPTVAAGLSLSHGLLSAGGRDPLNVYPWLLARPGHCYGYAYPGSPEASFLFHPYRKPKRIRTAFSPSQLLKLEQAFERNHYVVGQERKDLASKLGLTETQVKVWFQNRRTKYKRMKSEEDGGDVNEHKAQNSPGSGEEVEVEKEEECAQDNEEELELVDSHEEEEEGPMNCTMSSLT